MRFLRALALAATSAAVSAAATAALVRRRFTHAAPGTDRVPPPDAARLGDRDARDGQIARLEQDLAAVRALLESYLAEREATEAELHARTEALHESEARYRLLIDRAAYGIYRASPDGRFLDVNPALVAMLGYDSAEELLAVDAARDVFRDPAEREGLLARIRATDSADWVDVRWKRKDGTPITVRLSARMVRAESGAELYTEVIAEDVTARNRQEELLRRSERMASLGHTLAGVAHELNNPLAAIGGFAQLLLKSERPDDDRTALETINREARRAGTIVKDLLTFARRQEGHRRERVNVSEVVRYIFATQRYAMETRGIHHELDLDPGLPAVFGDRTQLEQVVLNLVVNARQAIEAVMDAPIAPGGAADRAAPRIAVHTRRARETVVVEVSDTGPGIPPGDLARIWDPFWTSKSEGEGTGLGLSVVHGIVTAHGGTIEAESEVGRGTRFIIRLPVAAVAAEGEVATLARDAGGVPAAAPTAVAPGAAGDGAARSGERSRGGSPPRPLDILLVDDEASILGFLVRYFTSRGHAVVSAQDGTHALRIAQQASFDVIVCDLRLPGADGSDVIRQMRALPTCAGARYIVSTGDGSAATDGQRIGDLEVAAVIQKPYAIDELRRVVEEG